MPNAPEPQPSSSIHQVPQVVEPEDISIVMPVFNHEATVAEAIESALMQKMPYKSAIYCLDDASTDRSGDILRDYAKRYPGRIKLYTSPNNLGTGKQTILYHHPPINGRYWCFLEGDDYWTSLDKLAKQIAFLDGHPDFVGCSCNTLMKKETTGEEYIIKPEQNTWNILDMLRGERALYVHTSSIIWRNIYLEQGYFLPPSYTNRLVRGDVVIMHVMLSKGGKIRNLPEVMSCYRVTGRGLWSSKSTEEQDELNRYPLPKMIFEVLPLKYRLYLFWRKLRRIIRTFLLRLQLINN